MQRKEGSRDITTICFGRLEVPWRFETGNPGPGFGDRARSAPPRYEAEPAFAVQRVGTIDATDLSHGGRAMRPSSRVRVFPASRPVMYALAVLLLGWGLGADPHLAAAQQPNRPPDAAQTDRAGQPPPGTQPTGEQNRNPGIDKDNDPRGNDRDFTTERGDRPGTSEPGPSAGTGISPIAIALAALAILAVAAVLMAVRRRKPTSNTHG
jgi:hypothetical protein